MKKVSITEIQQSLTPAFVKTFQIIFFALISSTTFFFIFVIFTYFKSITGHETDQQSLDTINYLTIIHAAIFISCLFIANFIYNRFLMEASFESMTNKMKISNIAKTADSYIGIIRSAKIIKISIIEVPVFIGLATCFIAATNQVMQQNPYYWLNALSYFVYIFLALKDFPTKEKILDIFKNKLKYLLEY